MSARLLIMCLGILTGSSCSKPRGNAHPNARPTTGASTTAEKVSQRDSKTYAYDLWIGRSLNHVEREADDAARVKVELIRWSESASGGREAVFRATNPGDRPVLVWNVRQQVRVSSADEVAKAWEMLQSDYPGRGWERSIIPAGGSVQFPMSSPSEAEWRVCLLYSREAPGSQTPNRRFSGTYESVGPGVREDGQ